MRDGGQQQEETSTLLNVVTAVDKGPLRDSGPKFKGLDVKRTRVLQAPQGR